MKTSRKIVLGLLVLIFIASSTIFVLLYWREYDISLRIHVFAINQTERAAFNYADRYPVSEWPQWVSISISRANERNPAAHTAGTDKPVPDVLSEYAALHQQNRDMIGWIKIADTNIDYAVMQTSGDPEYYLHRDFSGNYKYAGTPFLDANSDVLFPSANFLVYAHNMINKSMFGQLPNYLNQSFYETHQTIQFDTIYEKGEYEVIAVFRSQIYYHNDPVFRYYIWGYIDNEADFNYYLNNVMALAEYDTGKSAQWGDQLLTLSTCYYHVNEGRLVVVAKKVN